MRKSLFRLGGLGPLLFACVLSLSVAPTEETGPAKDAKPRTDRFGDPLPDGAVARLGTVRRRHPQDAETEKSKDTAIGHVGAVAGLIVSADGKSAVTLGRDNTVRIWEVPTATEKRKVFLPPRTDLGLLLGPRRVLLRTREGSLSVWDIEREKELVKVRQDKKPFPTPTRYDVSRDGKSLLTVKCPGFTVNNPQQATLYNLETGAVCPGVGRNWTRKPERSQDHEELASLAHASDGHRVIATIAVTGVPGFGGGVGELDRYLLRCKQSEQDQAFVWETRATEMEEICWAVAFTPDDRAILSFNRNFTFNSRPNRSQETWVSLLESLTGKERCRFWIRVAAYAHADWVHAFSRNGDLLAVGTTDGTTTVIDIRRGRVLTTLRGDQGLVRCLAFGSDAATLFTAGSDGTVLIWDLREHLRKARQAVELSPAEAKRLWIELADPDTVRAYRAAGALVTSPAQSVGLFREKLKPVKGVPAAEIDRLISDLESKRFQTREKASRELRRIGFQVTAALQRTLEKRPPLELRRRVEELLAELNQREALPSQDELRALRAIEVLEAIGTPPARSILESLVKGAPGMRLTDEAAAILKRWDKREPIRIR
jgi:WD40 repeat protein